MIALADLPEPITEAFALFLTGSIKDKQRAYTRQIQPKDRLTLAPGRDVPVNGKFGGQISP